MTDLDELRSWCLQLKGVTEDIKWGHDLCFSVASKMFLVVSLDSQPITASFKIPSDQFEEVSNKPGFVPAPYLARYHWVMIDDLNRLNRKDREQYILVSYHLVINKLPAKLKMHLLPNDK